MEIHTKYPIWVKGIVSTNPKRQKFTNSFKSYLLQRLFMCSKVRKQPIFSYFCYSYQHTLPDCKSQYLPVIYFKNNSYKVYLHCFVLVKIHVYFMYSYNVKLFCYKLVFYLRYLIPILYICTLYYCSFWITKYLNNQ